MTFDVIQNEHGLMAMILHGDGVPEGWTFIAETADPNYLVYMREIASPAE